MELKDIVCSLEHAKRLNELGVKQDSLFYWDAWYVGGKYRNADLATSRMGYENNETLSCENYSAFTASELGFFLPCIIKDYDLEILGMHGNDYDKYNKYWRVRYVRLWATDQKLFESHDFNEANARAKMLIHLIENKLWSPDAAI
jgi:hypothetical protein